MFLQLLCVTALLFQVITSQPVDKESAGCKYQLYESKKVKTHESWRVVDVISFDACVEECAKHNAGAKPKQLKCVGIMYTSSSKLCVKIGLFMGQPEENFALQEGTDTAIIKSCEAATGGKQQGDDSNKGCGRQHSDFLPHLTNDVRIVNGRIAKAHSWPWMLRMCTDTMYCLCGASLLSVRDDLEESDMAITAAHCVHTRTDLTKNSLFLYAGKHTVDETEDGEQKQKFADIRLFSTTDAVTDNDLALIRLEKPFKFSKTVRPACLPAKQDDSLPLDQTCVATGWGRNNSQDNYEISKVLKQATMPARTEEFCKDAWKDYNYYKTPNQFCSGNGFDSTCPGDSGGPLMCQESDGRWTQHGVTSYVAGQGTCVDRNMPAVFARFTHYVDWINDNIKNMTTL